MFQKPSGLLLHQLIDHVAQNCSDGVEALVGRAYVVKPIIIQKDFLNDENGDRLA